MRWRDGNGEKEFSGAMAVICARMAASDSCEKSSRSRKSVRRRVFDGGDGCERGGRLEISMVSDGRDVCDDPRDAMDDDEVGAATSDAIFNVTISSSIEKWRVCFNVCRMFPVVYG